MQLLHDCSTVLLDKQHDYLVQRQSKDLGSTGVPQAVHSETCMGARGRGAGEGARVLTDVRLGAGVLFGVAAGLFATQPGPGFASLLAATASAAFLAK